MIEVISPNGYSINEQVTTVNKMQHGSMEKYRNGWFKILVLLPSIVIPRIQTKSCKHMCVVFNCVVVTKSSQSQLTRIQMDSLEFFRCYPRSLWSYKILYYFRCIKCILNIHVRCTFIFDQIYKIYMFLSMNEKSFWLRNIFIVAIADPLQILT